MKKQSSPQSSDHKVIEAYIRAMTAERGFSQNTVAAYRRDLDGASASMPRGKALINATPNELRDILKIWSADLTPRSLARKQSALRGFMNFLVDDGIRADDPSLHLDAPKIGTSLPKSLSEDEIARLIQTAWEDRSNKGIQLLAMLELLYGAGLRVSELIGLRVSLFTRPRDHIMVKGKGDKDRVVVLTDAAKNAITNWITVRDSDPQLAFSKYLFPAKNNDKSVSRQDVYQRLQELAARSGLSSTISPHMLRHSFATHMLNRGADLRSLQILLGHADITTTEIYTRVNDERLAGLVVSAHPLAKEGDDGY